MVKQPKTTNGAQPSDAAPTYVIGYGRPPVHTRFKPGHRGRGGRPKRQRNLRTVLEQTLDQRITIREGNRTRQVTKRDAIILKLVNDAVSGNAKAMTNLIALMRSQDMMGQPEEEAELQPLTADDETIIADLLRRLENREESTQPAEHTERSEIEEAKSRGKENKETKS
jgi:Family of unknown function (DUF5681)